MNTVSYAYQTLHSLHLK